MRDTDSLDNLLNHTDEDQMIKDLLAGPSASVAHALLKTIGVAIGKGAGPIDVAVAIPTAVAMLTEKVSKDQALVIFDVVIDFLNIYREKTEERED